MALAAALALVACDGTPPAAGARLSLLAVGDTGAPPEQLRAYATARTVAQAMAEQDARRPVDALLFLGDNFYDRGLRREELARRMRANLALPWCRFLELTGPRSESMTEACRAPVARRHPVPIHAVLGNHDFMSPESPALEREVIPLYFPNWSLPAQPASLVDLGQGVSLVLFDSDPVFRGGSADALAEVLAASPGPWRIVAAHHPLAALRADSPEREREYAEYRRRVMGALSRADVPVQLFLAGHEHNLQILAMDPPAPALHVIAGGGSMPRAIRDENPRRLAGAAAPGFARVDLVGDGDDERLVASLYRLLPSPLAALRITQLVGRASVDLAGTVRHD